LNDGKVTSSLPRYDLESVRAPTLIVSAKDDRFGTYPAALYTTEHIAGARFIGYEKGGHLAVGHGEETQEAAASFFLENQ
jgi:pimeloyl-ACP methyl ester carboxylesterase